MEGGEKSGGGGGVKQPLPALPCPCFTWRARWYSARALADVVCVRSRFFLASSTFHSYL